MDVIKARFALDVATIEAKNIYDEFLKIEYRYKAMKQRWEEAEAKADRLFEELKAISPEEAEQYIAAS